MGRQARAIAKHIRISPQKVRPVVDMVRGKDVDEALALLQFSPQRAAEPVGKALQSAIANAENNHGLLREDLYVSEIRADEGPTLKRYRFGGRGRVKPRKRRSSHITVVVEEYEYEDYE